MYQNILTGCTNYVHWMYDVPYNYTCLVVAALHEEAPGLMQSAYIKPLPHPDPGRRHQNSGRTVAAACRKAAGNSGRLPQPCGRLPEIPAGCRKAAQQKSMISKS